jgi:hypothetical protein
LPFHTPFKSSPLGSKSDNNKKYKTFERIVDDKRATTVLMNLTTPSKEDVDIIVKADYISASLEYFYKRIKEDGKNIPKASTSTFLLTLGVGIPVWISFLLPMTMIY